MEQIISDNKNPTDDFLNEQTLNCKTTVIKKEGDKITFQHRVDLDEFPLSEQTIMDCLREYKRILMEKLK